MAGRLVGGIEHRRRRRLARLLRPRVLLPVILAGALLGFAFSISNVGRVWAGIARIPFHTMVASLLLALAYLGLKGAQFRFLLGSLGIEVPWRALVLAFVIGEMTLTVPSGIYIQNYVLKRIEQAGFARSSAATTVTLMIEAALVLFMLLLIPIPGWSWVRPLVLVGLAGGAGVAVLLGVGRPGLALRRRLKRSRFGKMGRGLVGFVDAMKRLSTPRVLVPAALLAAVYMAALIGVFLLAAHGTGVTRLHLFEAISIYAFSLAVTLMLGGVLSQLGVIEVAGIGAAHAWGYSVSESLGMLLGFRLLWMASIWLICAPVAWALRREFRRSATDDLQKPAY